MRCWLLVCCRYTESGLSCANVTWDADAFLLLLSCIVFASGTVCTLPALDRSCMRSCLRIVLRNVDKLSMMLSIVNMPHVKYSLTFDS